jgi:hypothetical protein
VLCGARYRFEASPTGKIEAKRKLFCFLAWKRNSQNLKQKENEMKRDERKQVKQKQHKAKSKK